MSATAFQRLRREAKAQPAADTPVTRVTIAKMKRDDVVEHLEAHGLTAEDCKGVTVGDLREMLIDVMFVGS